MYRVRILVDGFVMGTTSYPKGSELTVNLPVYNLLTAERKAELVDTETPAPDVTPEKGTYARRDMQAEAPKTAPPKPKMPVHGNKKRGRPPGAKNKTKPKIKA